jgi:hypothetical protein
MKIDSTIFGAITITERLSTRRGRSPSGEVGREKEAIKEAHGTSHVLQKTRQSFERGAIRSSLARVSGNVHLSPEAEAYFERKGCESC